MSLLSDIAKRVHTICHLRKHWKWRTSPRFWYNVQITANKNVSAKWTSGKNISPINSIILSGTMICMNRINDQVFCLSVCTNVSIISEDMKCSYVFGSYYWGLTNVSNWYTGHNLSTVCTQTTHRLLFGWFVQMS